MRITEVADNEVVVNAPAKVNLVFRVLDRLPNGYHELWSLMHTVEVCDQVRIRLDPHRAHIRLTCGDSTLPVDGRNLVYQATEKVLQAAGEKVGVTLELKKCIPHGAGLGGGSSDAAATIYGLSHMLQLEWDPMDYVNMGAEIGSDVPFFFQAPCAVVSGWGNQVRSCSLEGQRWIVLVNPGFPIQTSWAYAQLAAHRSEASGLTPWTQKIDQDLRISWEEILAVIENDFEAPLFPLYPILGFIKDKLLSLGAQAALLSGSGSTVFGIFASKEAAEWTSAQLRQNTEWEVFAVGTGSLPDSHRAHNSSVPFTSTSI